MGAQQYYRTTGLAKPFEWGNALWMDSIDDSVHIPYSPSMDFTGKSFAIVMWVYKPAFATSLEGLVANWNGIDNTAQHFSYMAHTTGVGAVARVRTGNSTDGQWAQSGEALSGYGLGQWLFRVVQFDRIGIDGRMPNHIMFIDSRINSDPSFPVGLPFWSSFNTNINVLQDYSFTDKTWTFNAPIGSQAGGRGARYIDNVAFFDRAITDAEVLRMYKRGRGYLPTKIPNCVACYLFNEPTGTAITSSAQTPGSPASRIILDQSGNGNHAYAVGYGSGSTDFVDHHTLI